MAVFRVERNTGYTVMSNHHLRNKELSLKAKGLLSQMLSLPEDWDYTLAGLSHINREKIDAIREAVKELEKAGYIVRSRERDEKGRLRGADYVIYEQPQPREPEAATSDEQPPIRVWDYPNKHFSQTGTRLLCLLSALFFYHYYGGNARFGKSYENKNARFQMKLVREYSSHPCF